MNLGNEIFFIHVAPKPQNISESLYSLEDSTV